MPRHIKTAALAGQQEEADAKVRTTVEAIIADVAKRGDAAVRELSERFDKWSPPSFRLSDDEIAALVAKVVAADDRRHQIRPGADPQFRRDPARLAEGRRGGDAARGDARPPPHPGRQRRLLCAGRALSDGRLGAHVDRHRQGRRGRHITACTPPNQGGPHPETIAAMHLGGADEIYVLGGVQAVAAMALGTETFKPVDMLVGPGNAYVAEAKRQLYGRVGIDLFAGPTEILVIADDTADAEMCATDLLGQAEHGPTSPAILLTTSEKLAHATIAEIDRQLTRAADRRCRRHRLARSRRGHPVRRR